MVKGTKARSPASRGGPFRPGAFLWAGFPRPCAQPCRSSVRQSGAFAFVPQIPAVRSTRIHLTLCTWPACCFQQYVQLHRDQKCNLSCQIEGLAEWLAHGRASEALMSFIIIHHYVYMPRDNVCHVQNLVLFLAPLIILCPIINPFDCFLGFTLNLTCWPKVPSEAFLHVSQHLIILGPLLPKLSALIHFQFQVSKHSIFGHFLT